MQKKAFVDQEIIKRFQEDVKAHRMPPAKIPPLEYRQRIVHELYNAENEEEKEKWVNVVKIAKKEKKEAYEKVVSGSNKTAETIHA